VTLLATAGDCALSIVATTLSRLSHSLAIEHLDDSSRVLEDCDHLAESVQARVTRAQLPSVLVTAVSFLRCLEVVLEALPDAQVLVVETNPTVDDGTPCSDSQPSVEPRIGFDEQAQTNVRLLLDKPQFRKRTHLMPVQEIFDEENLFTVSRWLQLPGRLFTPFASCPGHLISWCGRVMAGMVTVSNSHWEAESLPAPHRRGNSQQRNTHKLDARALNATPRAAANSGISGPDGGKTAYAVFFTRGPPLAETVTRDVIPFLRALSRVDSRRDVIFAWSIDTPWKTEAHTRAALGTWISRVTIRRVRTIGAQHLAPALQDTVRRSNNCCGWREFQSLALFSLVDYEVLVMLEVDMRLLEPVDELFETRLDFAATVGSVAPLNSGMAIVRPNVAIYNEMVDGLWHWTYSQNTGWNGAGQSPPTMFSGARGSATETNQGFLWYFFYQREHNYNVGMLDMCRYNYQLGTELLELLTKLVSRGQLRASVIDACMREAWDEVAILHKWRDDLPPVLKSKLQRATGVNATR